MPGGAIGLSLGMCYAGQPTVLNPQPVTETHPVAATSQNIPFGAPVISNGDNTVSMADATITAANFGGIAANTTGQNNTYVAPGTNSGIGGYYPPGSPCSVHKEGYFGVFVGYGAANVTNGGKVYVRKATSANVPSAAAIGQFEALADSTANVEITSARWFTNHVDANGMAQVKLIYAAN